MNRIINNCEIAVVNEPTYSRNSSDNVRSYKHEYCRNNDYKHISAHGVIVGDIEHPDSSAIMLGVGGSTGVHEDSVTFNGNTIYVAAGDAIFALDFPSLELKWCRKVDFATCFGVYWLKEYNCLITWGELNVCRLTEEGREAWSASGPDVFTEGFEIDRGTIKITDFNNDIYHVNIETGDIVQLNT
ncbi:hypothetical protein [Alkalimarinus sediminis]|uniref:Uncharacterized protein n=2 Tax=Alkalimarinus sediminis TaxID=1632866 RepID=A0A9E8HKT0_9ALTE|nr:hypothetical protein [Alkalimarinus sediminis]UZW74523.1 hypothetical protein NNL22_16090 [Alkalimarinus sediminis]